MSGWLRALCGGGAMVELCRRLREGTGFVRPSRAQAGNALKIPLSFVSIRSERLISRRHTSSVVAHRSAAMLRLANDANTSLPWIASFKTASVVMFCGFSAAKYINETTAKKVVYITNQCAPFNNPFCFICTHRWIWFLERFTYEAAHV